MARRRIRRKRPIRDAMGALEQAANQGAATAVLARGVFQELTDGVHIKLVRTKEGPTLLDFLRGTIAEFPVEIRIDLLEPEDK